MISVSLPWIIFEMISRRQFLAATIAAGMSTKLLADSGQQGVPQEELSWSVFKEKMLILAQTDDEGGLSKQTMAELATQYLKSLDLHSAEFADAIEASYETGNRYWLWQRMVKEKNINGGVLTIDRENLVQLHDHPGATGVVRIISGEAEVWQFDVAESGQRSNDVTELKRVSHRFLKAGDMAVLTPERGNIHALRSVSKQCQMLDFFIPPYQNNQRNWYQPLNADWFDKKKIACKKVSQQDFMQA